LCGSWLKGKKLKRDAEQKEKSFLSIKSMFFGRDRTWHNEEVNGVVCGALL
jgi:hypothetical protein